ncbi:MAG: class I SAM-dependent methyltransferase [Ktedonobacterales bacterium]
MTDTERAEARARFKRLAAEFTEKGDPTGWFEVLYQAAAGNEEAIPWAHLTANPLLVEWMARHHISGDGRSALVVGCGLGDDAEAMAHYGFAVTAFDISPEAIRWCQRRFPSSQVHYTVADVLALPDAWSQQFDFIVEAYTLQSLPDEALRAQAAANLARCVAPQGSLLVICRGRERHEERGTMPWPLTRAELAVCEQQGLRQVSFEDLLDPEEPSVKRFRVYFQR